MRRESPARNAMKKKKILQLICESVSKSEQKQRTWKTE